MKEFDSWTVELPQVKENKARQFPAWSGFKSRKVCPASLKAAGQSACRKGRRQQGSARRAGRRRAVAEAAEAAEAAQAARESHQLKAR